MLSSKFVSAFESIFRPLHLVLAADRVKNRIGFSVVSSLSPKMTEAVTRGEREADKLTTLTVVI